MFKIRLQKEVWDDDRDPKLIVAWESVFDSFAEIPETIRTLAFGLQPKHIDDSFQWEIVITNESAR